MDPVQWLSEQMEFGKKIDIPNPPIFVNEIGCKKAFYESRHEAEKYLSKALTRRRNRPKFLRVYHCNRCQGWHITSQERRNS
jgi:hypothetical protein